MRRYLPGPFFFDEGGGGAGGGGVGGWSNGQPLVLVSSRIYRQDGWPAARARACARLRGRRARAMYKYLHNAAPAWLGDMTCLGQTDEAKQRAPGWPGYRPT